ncbi:MAG: ATP-binding cassette domain-containing protein [Candidatus Micrarchaeaceae archaeon]
MEGRDEKNIGDNGISMTENSIEVKNLKKAFGNFVAVDSISFSVKKGEIFGLLGPNGAGKTTTINMIIGIVKPTSGSILVEGIDAIKNSERVKELIGFMTQETIADSDLSVKENLEIFAELFGMRGAERDRAVEEAIREANLVDFKNAKAGAISGGMQRRLNLVRAMIHKPKIIVLDEPTTGLDVQNRIEMWNKIRSLQKKGVTTIITTQYLEEADELCDRIAIIDHGKIKAIGTPSELKKQVSEGEIVELSVANESIEKAMKLIKELGLEPYKSGDKIRFPVKKDPTKVLTSLLNSLYKSKIEVLYLEMHLPTLDDVFIKITGSALRDSTGEMKSNFSMIHIHR